MSDSRASAAIQPGCLAGRGPGRRARFEPRLLALLVAATFAQPLVVRALPEGAQVIAGRAAVSQPSAGRMLIQQGSDRAIVDWQGFSIGSPERVEFQQPAASSAILNRVIGEQRSEIHGTMTANGQVFLVNRNGVLFGRGARVDVGGLVASTLDIGNQDFLDGRYRFQGQGRPGTVENVGQLRAAEGGTVALLGGQIRNDGTIEAKLGTAALAAGNRVTLDFAGDGLTRVTVDEAVLEAQVQNNGAVIVDGGQAVMTARAADAAVRTVVNQSGIVRARSLVERDGRIVLDGGESGRTQVSGTLDASGSDEAAGGGQVQVRGREVALAAGARIDAGGARGGGTVQVGGGDSRGQPGAGSRSATATTMASEASIVADARNAGAGGRVVVRSEGRTRVRGKISARGGSNGGDGGQVETSGRQLEVGGARIDAGAPQGRPGKWLLDPVDVTIDESMAGAISGALATTDVAVTTDPQGEDPGDAGDIRVQASIEKTGGSGSTTTLSLRAHRNIEVGRRVGIELVPQQNGSFAEVRIGSTAGPLNVELIARKDETEPGAPGAVTLLPRAAIVTNGGSVLISGGSDPRDEVNGRAMADTGFQLSNPAGVSLQNAVIDSRGPALQAGSIELRGLGGGTFESDDRVLGGSGVELVESTVTGGTLTIDGSGGQGLQGPGGAGVAILSLSIVEARASLSISGAGGDIHAARFFEGAGSGVLVSDSMVSGAAMSISAGGGAAFGSDGSGIGGNGFTLDSSAASGNTLTIAGIGGAAAMGLGGTGIVLQSSRAFVNGAISMAGTGGSVPAVQPFGGAGSGVAIIQSNLTSEIDASISGFAGTSPIGSNFTAGVAIESSTLRADGTLALAGQAPQAIGVRIQALEDDPTTLAGDRAVRVFGSGNEETPAQIGLWMRSTSESGILAPITVSTNGGETALGGRGNRGVVIAESTRIESLAAGGRPRQPIDIRGFSSSTTGGTDPALLIGDGVSIEARGSGGTIVLGAAAGSERNSGDLFQLAGGENAPSFTADAVVVAPVYFAADGSSRLSADIPIDVGAAPRPGVPFHLSTLELSNLASNASAVVVGGPSQRQPITLLEEVRLSGEPPVGSSLTLQQDQTPGSASGISIDVPVSVDGTLALISSGAITQTAPVSATKLLLSSSAGSITFEDPSNEVFTLAIDARGGAARFVDSGSLALGDVAAWRVTNADSTAVAFQALSQSHAAASFFARSLSDILELQHDISTGSGEITLVSGLVFRNTENATLSPGGSRWTIWADTWRGGEETPAEQRGGLTPSSPLPNLYTGCGFGNSDCEGASGVTVPVTGNHFVYSERPVLEFTAADAIRTYGDPNPAFPITVLSGLQPELGDTQADAIEGSLSSSTGPTTNVGIYPVEADISSPAGYILLGPEAVTLTITPAMLTYVADPASREYGLENPPLSGSVTGFRNDETLATATTGTLTFSTPATAASNVGRYPIIGSGLVANNGNYDFMQAPSNDTALTIDPAVLTYFANPATRTVGTANPEFSGNVIGFRLNDTLESATEGTLRFQSPATADSPAGTYPILGSGLTALNYDFVQAPANATALVVTLTPLPVDVVNRGIQPVLWSVRNPDTDPAYVYGRNFGPPQMCIPFGSLATASGRPPTSDLLEIEWARVRNQPNLTNCVSLDDREYCNDF